MGDVRRTRPMLNCRWAIVAGRTMRRVADRALRRRNIATFVCVLIDGCWSVDVEKMYDSLTRYFELPAFWREVYRVNTLNGSQNG